MALPWTQKYAPASTKDIVGQETIVADILDFIKNRKTSKKKAILMHGPPGCGKTSSIHAIAEELGMEVFEVNASDTRNKASIEEIVGAAAKTQSLFGGEKLILVDEVDGIAGNQDRGGVPALARMIAASQFPLIMTCNDPTHKKFSPLRSKSKIIIFKQLEAQQIATVLKDILQKENITFDEEAVKHIARSANGDLRGAINDIEALCENKNSLTKEDLPSLGERDYLVPIEDALLVPFKQSDFTQVVQAFNNTKEDLDTALLWMEENVPREYTRPGDIYRAFNALSLATVHKGRIRRRQYWRLMVYINLFLTCGVAAAKQGPYKKEVTYKRNSRILKMWQAKMSGMKKKSIAEKLATYCHVSQKRATQDILPYFKMYAKAQQTRMGPLYEKLDLSEEEVDWLLKK